ncbi:MAG: two-component regulator propeller domain-containing protein [Niabella sp.]
MLLANLLQAQNVRFNHFSVNEGLSQATVNCMLQDSLGRIWLGTRDGLNCFDGVSTKVFKPVQGDPTSLPGNQIIKIRLHGDHIWVLTENGLARLDQKTLKFEQYPIRKITDFVFLEGRIILSAFENMYELDWKNRRYLLRKDLSGLMHGGNCMLALRNGGLLIGRKSDNRSQVNLVKHSGSNTPDIAVSNLNISKLFQDDNGHIWIGTNGDGVMVMDESLKLIHHYTQGNGPNDLCDNFVYDISQDRLKNIWIGTMNGASRFNPRTGIFYTYKPTESESGLSHEGVLSIMQDHQDNIWLGTYYGGANYFKLDNNNYNYYSTAGTREYKLNNNLACEMVEDNTGNIWIATEGGGINILNKETRKISLLTKEQGLSGNNVQSLYFDGVATIYAGTHGDGFNEIDIKTRKITHYKSIAGNPNSLPSNVVYCIVPYRDSLILGTRKGAVFFHKKDKTFRSIHDSTDRALNNAIVFSALVDHSGNIWMGTSGNLLHYDPRRQRIIKQQNALSQATDRGKSIYSVFEDRQQQLWIGSFGNGLLCYNSANGTLTSYTTHNTSLQSNFIYDIDQLPDGNMLLATLSGLSIFDNKTNTFYNYQSRGGFPLRELNKRSLLVSNNEIFAGGINGLVSFYRHESLAFSRQDALMFSSLSANNKEVLPGDGTGILEQSMPYTSAIVLQPNIRVFTIGFASCNYQEDLKTYYSVKLEGFDNEWVDYQTKHSATYTNLDAGNYVFKVRAMHPVTNAVLSEKSLHITIKEPFYKTTYALALYALALLGLFYFFYRMKIGQIKLSHQLATEKLNTENESKLTRSKLRFFTNLSHEFRTPLTLIMGLTEGIMEEGGIPARFKKKIQSIYNNSLSLNNLITELLDFRKLEQDSVKLHVTECELTSYINAQMDAFEEYLQQKDIQISITGTTDKLMVWIDEHRMKHVFNNLVSNAIKHLDKEKKVIDIHTSADEEYIYISIKDNGCGIPQSELSNIFNQFYNTENPDGKNSFSASSGIGLFYARGIAEAHGGRIDVKSILGSGSEFVVVLKKGNAHFHQEQLKPPVTDLQEQDAAIIFPEESSRNEGNVSMSDPDKNRKLLVVEDNDEIRILIRNKFISEFQIVEAADGDAGLQMAVQIQPDIIISDIIMPKQSGTELCRKLKNNIETSHIPIILLTAKSGLDDTLEGVEVGADLYVTKPFSSRLLRAQVKNLLRNREQVQNRYRAEVGLNAREMAVNQLDREWLCRVEQVLEENISNSLFGVNEFAAEMNMGRTTFYNKIKSLSGQPPNEFIQSYRLKKAAKMIIEDPSLNMTDIAYETGFNSLKYFGQCFRDFFGVPPSKYAKSMKT